MTELKQRCSSALTQTMKQSLRSQLSSSSRHLASSAAGTIRHQMLSRSLSAKMVKSTSSRSLASNDEVTNPRHLAPIPAQVLPSTPAPQALDLITLDRQVVHNRVQPHLRCTQEARQPLALHINKLTLSLRDRQEMPALCTRHLAAH